MDELKKIIETKDAASLAELIDSMQSIDFAHLLSDLEDEELAELIPLIEDHTLTEIIEESEDDDRIRIAKQLDNNRMLKIFGYMQKDDIVDMLGDFPIGRRKEILNRMKADDRQIITDLLKYPDDSAGGLMTSAYIALREDITVAQAFRKIQQIGPKTEVIEVIFIVNAKRQLIGTCDLRDILSTPGEDPLSSIMDPDVISVEPETDQEEMAKLVSKYDLKVIPVISRTKQILGIITVDDVIDVIVEELDKDLAQMTGVSTEENLDTTLLESVRMRLPWLLVNLLTAFLASFTVSLFENTIQRVVALSSIMTIVSGMGGNAGTQTMSVLVRQLSKEKRSPSEYVKAFTKEILLGIVNGAATGAVTMIVVGVKTNNWFLGLIVLIAMIGNLVVSGIFGFLVPLVLDSCHADPAVSSSIFVTTATDVLGFFIFLGLASVFINHLV